MNFNIANCYSRRCALFKSSAFLYASPSNHLAHRDIRFTNDNGDQITGTFPVAPAAAYPALVLTVNVFLIGEFGRLPSDSLAESI